jgi:hypothetical protein
MPDNRPAGRTRSDSTFVAAIGRPGGRRASPSPLALMVDAPKTAPSAKLQESVSLTSCA